MFLVNECMSFVWTKLWVTIRGKYTVGRNELCWWRARPLNEITKAYFKPWMTVRVYCFVEYHSPLFSFVSFSLVFFSLMRIVVVAILFIFNVSIFIKSTKDKKKIHFRSLMYYLNISNTDCSIFSETTK